MDPYTPFPFEQLDENSEEELSPEVLARIASDSNEKTIKAFCALIAWITDQGRATESTAGRRSYVVGWALLDSLRALNQKEMACLLVLNHKQAFGRHVTDFTKTFGPMILPHQFTENAHHKCEIREEENRKSEIFRVQGLLNQLREEHAEIVEEIEDRKRRIEERETQLEQEEV